MSGSLKLGYDRRRLRRQLVALAVMGLMMLAFGAFGVWMIVASAAQYPGRAEQWVGAAFGGFFALLSLACTVSLVEALTGMRRMRPPRILLSVDERGIDGIGRPYGTVRWSDIERVECTRVGAKAAVTPRWPVVGETADRVVGAGFAVKDGTRTVVVVRHDGERVVHPLTKAVGDEDFALAGSTIHSIAAAHDVPCELSWE